MVACNRYRREIVTLMFRFGVSAIRHSLPPSHYFFPEIRRRSSLPKFLSISPFLPSLPLFLSPRPPRFQDEDEERRVGIERTTTTNGGKRGDRIAVKKKSDTDTEGEKDSSERRSKMPPRQKSLFICGEATLVSTDYL